VIQLEGDGTTPANTGRFEAPPQKTAYRKPEKDFARANLLAGLKGLVISGGWYKSL
jgi:hypothetical protein